MDINQVFKLILPALMVSGKYRKTLAITETLPHRHGAISSLTRVSWLFMAKVQRLQYGVDRIEDGGDMVRDVRAFWLSCLATLDLRIEASRHLLRAY